MPPPAVRGAAAWSAVLLLFAGVSAVVVAACVLLRAAVVPVLLALLVSALLLPLDRSLRRAGLGKAAAAAGSCAALVVVIGGAVWLLVTLLSDASGQIATALREAARKPAGDGPVAKAVRGAADGLGDLGRNLAEGAAKGVLSGLGLAAQLLAVAVLVLVLSFFLLRDRTRLRTALHTVTGRHGGLAVRVGQRGFRAMAGFMRGTTFIAAVDAVLIAAGLAVLGVPSPFALGALVFVGAYVPYVGAFLAGAVAVLVGFAEGGLPMALGAVGVVLAVQVIEGALLQPLVQSRTVRLHPALVMLAITAGAAVGGLVGTLLAVPLTAAAFAVVAELRREEADIADDDSESARREGAPPPRTGWGVSSK